MRNFMTAAPAEPISNVTDISFNKQDSATASKRGTPGSNLRDRMIERMRSSSGSPVDKKADFYIVT